MIQLQPIARSVALVLGITLFATVGIEVAQATDPQEKGGLGAGPVEKLSATSLAVAQGDNLARDAQVTTSYVSPWETLAAVNDGSSPANSNDKSSGAYGNWPRPNQYQWVEYRWPYSVRLNASEIYWFDDRRGVWAPTDAFLEYWNGSAWINAGSLPRNVNQFNLLSLQDVVTDRVRVQMRNSTQSTGILEWRTWGVRAGGVGGAVPYRAITNEFTHLNVTPTNARFRDSDRFRAYYGGGGLNGGQSNLANVPEAQIETGMAHLEAAYECFVNQWGFRSPSLSVGTTGPYYKMNLYSTTTLNAGGAMGANGRHRLSFLEFRDNAISRPETAVHEFGHSLSYADFTWTDQGATGAWWESVANWVSDTYNTDPLCESVRERRGLARSRDTIINLETNIAQAFLPIVSTRNYYQAWPFLTYLTQNPDRYPGVGRMAVPDIHKNHRRNNETPLHVLQRLVAPVTVQEVVGRFWARMAYLDIGHPKAQARFLALRNDGGFRSRAFANLDSLGNGRYRVKPAREPRYAGANITPLRATAGGAVSVRVTNLGNGQAGSAFMATLSIRNTASGAIRYVDLLGGAGSATIASNEEASLVVANTPITLIQYNAFESTDTSPESIGLRYEVALTGAVPTNL